MKNKTQDLDRTYRRICACITAGGTVWVCTHYRRTAYKKVEQFRLTNKSLYVRRGRNWDCIDYCAIGFEGTSDVLDTVREVAI